MRHQLVRFRSMTRKRDHHCIVRIACPQLAERTLDSLTRAIRARQQYGRAAQRIGEQRFKRYCIAPRACQLVNPCRDVTVNADEEAAKSHGAVRPDGYMKRKAPAFPLSQAR